MYKVIFLSENLKNKAARGLYFSNAIFEGPVFEAVYIWREILVTRSDRLLYLEKNVCLRIDWDSSQLKGNLCQQFARSYSLKLAVRDVELSTTQLCKLKTQPQITGCRVAK